MGFPSPPRSAPRRRRPDQAARPGPDRRPDGPGQLRRARLLAGHAAAPHPVRDPGVRGRAGGAGRPPVHPDRDRGPAHLPVRPGLAAGGAGRRAARRRVPVPGGHRGLRPLPARRAGDAGGSAALRRRRLGRGGAGGRPADPGRQAVRPRARPPGAQGDRPPHAGADPDRRAEGAARPAPAPVRGHRPGARAGARPQAPAQRGGRMRRRARRPRPAGRNAPRLRPAGPGGRAARADRRGTPPPGRHGRVPDHRP